MKITEVTIENFRAFEKETIHFGDYVSFVGSNGSGKSTVLTALRIFFRDTADTTTDLQALQEEDFHNKNTQDNVVITVVFTDLNNEAQAELQHYYRNGKLIVSAVAKWEEATRCARVFQYGERLVMAAFRPYFDAEKSGKSATELSEIYDNLRASYPDLPLARTKGQKAEALTAYEAAHPGDLELARSEDKFYGFTQGESRLQKFIQWIFIPAVKDASTENAENKKNAFRLLLERTVRSKLSFDDVLKQIRAETEERYKAILAERQEALRSLSDSLTTRLARWAHPNASLKVQWDEDASNQVKIGEPFARVLGREGMFEGDLSRFGHGFQRSYLLALLQELAGCGDSGNPRLILACEEPELHQHPPQARHLAGVLHHLAEHNTQVIVSTHSPLFVRGLTFDDVRCVRYNHGKQASCVQNLDLDEVAEIIGSALGKKPIASTGLELKIEQALQERIGEMFFAPALVFVEGIEDIGYIQTYITLLNLHESLRGLSCHIVPTSGKNSMIRPLAIAKQLNISAFAIIDADPNDQKNRANHERDNLAIMRLCGVGNAEAFPTQTLLNSNINICVWRTKIGDVVQEEIGNADWERLATEVSQKRNIHSNHDKNPLFIGSVLSAAWDADKRSPTLEKLCRTVMAFATRAAKV